MARRAGAYRVRREEGEEEVVILVLPIVTPSRPGARASCMAAFLAVGRSGADGSALGLAPGVAPVVWEGAGEQWAGG